MPDQIFRKNFEKETNEFVRPSTRFGTIIGNGHMLPFEHRALRNLAPKAPVGPKCAHNIHRGYSSPYKAPLTYPVCIHKLAGDSRVGSGRDRRQRGEGGYLPGEHLPTDRRRYAQTGRPEFCMRLPPTRTLSLPLLLRIAQSSRRRPTRSFKTIVLPFSTRSFFTAFCAMSVCLFEKNQLRVSSVGKEEAVYIA